MANNLTALLLSIVSNFKLNAMLQSGTLLPTTSLQATWNSAHCRRIRSRSDVPKSVNKYKAQAWRSHCRHTLVLIPSPSYPLLWLDMIWVIWYQSWLTTSIIIFFLIPISLLTSGPMLNYGHLFGTRMVKQQHSEMGWEAVSTTWCFKYLVGLERLQIQIVFVGYLVVDSRHGMFSYPFHRCWKFCRRFTSFLSEVFYFPRISVPIALPHPPNLNSILHFSHLISYRLCLDTLKQLYYWTCSSRTT